MSLLTTWVEKVEFFNYSSTNRFRFIIERLIKHLCLCWVIIIFVVFLKSKRYENLGRNIYKKLDWYIIKTMEGVRKWNFTRKTSRVLKDITNSVLWGRVEVLIFDICKETEKDRFRVSGKFTATYQSLCMIWGVNGFY